MKNQPIALERLLNAPIQKVWTAITNKDEMKQWYFDLVEFKPEIGFQFQFTGGPQDGVQYLHLCEVTDVIPEKKLTYSWRYQGYPGNSFVTFELIAQNEQTLLRLTHTGLETFPQDNEDFASQNFVEGWNHIVNISLKNHLEK